MSKKGKLILFFCVSILAFYLTRKLFIVSGLAIVGEVATYLLLAVVGLIGINILVPKEYRAWANLLPILCALIFSVMGIKDWHQSYKDNKEAKGNTLMTLTEKSWARAEIILTNRIVDQAAKKLGLSQEKPSQTKKSYFRRTTTSQEKVVETPTPTGTWGKTIATRSPPFPSSMINSARTEAQKAMQRVANPGRRVKIE